MAPVLSVLRDSDDDRCRGNILPSAAPVFRGCDERQHVLYAGVHVGLIVERAENDTVSLIQKNSEGITVHSARATQTKHRLSACKSLMKLRAARCSPGQPGF
jgi:hypothetical protein